MEFFHFVYMLIFRLATLPPVLYPETTAIATAILMGIGMVTTVILYMKRIAQRETNRIINAINQLPFNKEK